MSVTTESMTAAFTAKYESTERQIASARASVMDILQDEQYLLHERLGRAVNTLAALEGRQVVLARLVNMAEREFSAEYMLQRLAEMMATGANDTYSGRGNDVARAHFDGIREAAAETIQHLLVATR